MKVVVKTSCRVGRGSGSIKCSTSSLSCCRARSAVARVTATRSCNCIVKDHLLVEDPRSPDGSERASRFIFTISRSSLTKRSNSSSSAANRFSRCFDPANVRRFGWDFDKLPLCTFNGLFARICDPVANANDRAVRTVWLELVDIQKWVGKNPRSLQYAEGARCRTQRSMRICGFLQRPIDRESCVLRLAVVQSYPGRQRRAHRWIRNRGRAPTKAVVRAVVAPAGFLATEHLAAGAVPSRPCSREDAVEPIHTPSGLSIQRSSVEGCGDGTADVL